MQRTRTAATSLSSTKSAFCLALVAILVTPAWAETIKVTPGEGAIQDAIEIADPGDVISIGAGTYHELLTIPEDKDAIELVGKGRVVLDAYVEDGPDGEPVQEDAIICNARDVVFRNLVIRHASGIGIRVDENLMSVRSGYVVERVTFENIDGSAILMVADTVTVSRCTFWDIDSEAIEITGNGAVVTRNDIRQCVDAGVRITGNGASVTKNAIAHVREGSGVLIEGNNAVVESNTTLSTDELGIAVEGGSPFVNKNRVGGAGAEDGSHAGIEVIGSSPTITANRVTGVMNCHPSIIYWFSDEFADDGDGGQPPGLIDRNTVTHGNGVGMQLQGDNLTVSRNKVVDCGAERWGMIVEGNANEAVSNLVRGVAGDGIFVLGIGNLLLKNKVQDCSVDGIMVGGGLLPDGERTGDTVLDGNTITGNRSEGVDNRGANTILRNNKISKNRIDVVNDAEGGATIEVEPNNKIGDGSDGSDPPEV